MGGVHRTPYWKTGAGLVGLIAIYVVCWHMVSGDLGRLASGLPNLAEWASRAWPPDFEQGETMLVRAGETLAMATLGTTAAAVLALPMAWLAARPVTPSLWLYYPCRWYLNLLRGIDSFIFALLFVAAVGLGPFAGVLGVALHTWGSMAKLYAENIESSNLQPFQTAIAAGTPRFRAVFYVLIPDVKPALVAVTLYFWEFTIRASTVLGLVGAGGIGQMLKNNLDLMNFPVVLAVLIVIVGLVTIADQISAWLRARLTA